MSNIFIFLLLGLLAGTTSGLIGIGSGVIIVPALIFFFGFSEHLAQGTTLALMVPPIGILAAYEYWKNGFVDWRVAILICIGFVIGGYFGSKIAIDLPDGILQKIFGAGIIAIGLYMIIKK
ncbi:MAG: sulfite exporter TauE/SafE family protein [Candidatus Pacebacteria bacterium]|nr:sulfite exporter TauE/SafE family protein [Candidatus Paceibacterota bacterium]MDR3582756.1 sulfite exporter TauE/SafE family protein [Candidatus Paceibacterota bacterium]